MDFWELTPYEISLITDAYQKRIKSEYKQSVTLTYMNAYWVNQWQKKRKPPSLDKILDEKTERKTMTDEQMFRAVKALHKSFGGE